MSVVLSALHLAAILNGVDYELIRGVCFKESSLNPNAYVHNDGGSPSIGLCQIKQTTAKSMGFRGRESLLRDPYINAFFSAKYLAYQIKRYKGNVRKALSAYNAGRAITSNGHYVTSIMVLAYGD